MNLAALLVPIVACGYIMAMGLPTERLMLSLYQGWARYLRFAAYGLALAIGFLLHFCLIQPTLFIFLGKITNITLTSEPNLITLLYSIVTNSTTLALQSKNDPFAVFSLVFTTALLIETCLIVYILNFFIFGDENDLSRKANKHLKNPLFIENYYVKVALDIFDKKAPLEHQLLKISSKINQKLENDITDKTTIEFTEEEIQKVKEHLETN